MAINVSNIVTALQQKQNLVTSDSDILEISKLLKAINTTNEELVSIVDITYVDGLTNALDLKSDKSTTYTKTEVDTAISAATPTFDTILDKPSTISGYGITDAYTKTEVNSVLDLKANQSTTYTKTEVDTAISAATPTFSSLTGKPTTVSGYGITDTYTKTQVDTNISGAISNLVNSAPAALDTLNELATALGNDASFASTVTTSLSNKVDKTTTVNGHALSGNVSVTASDVGLGNVNNTQQLAYTQALAITGDVTASSTNLNTGTIATTLANSGVTAGTYTKTTVDAKGRVTSGTTLSSSDLPTYTGTITSSQVTTGLGFTPYNSTNPSGYITSSGSITGNATTATTATNQSGGTVSATNVSYSGTLTGGADIVNIGSGQIYKDANGNVGIGTSSPSQKLHIVSADPRIKMSTGSRTCEIGVDSNGGWLQTRESGSDLRFYTDAAVQAMRLDASGNLSVTGGITSAGNTVVTSANVGSYVSLFGTGQTWQSVSRSTGTTYTNSTGKAIVVNVVSGYGVNVGAGIVATVNGVGFWISFGGKDGSGQPAGSFIVPNGATYSVSSSGGISTWHELR